MNSNRRLFWLSFLVAAIAVLFGWSAVENASDLRTCELSVGATNDASAKIGIRRVTTSAFTRVVRIDYDLTPPGMKQTFNRFLVCRFSAERAPPFKSELKALITEFGPLPDASLFMLKRFYLETDEVRSAKTPAANGSPAGGIVRLLAHMAEWLLSVAAQASLLTLLAFVFLALTGLLRALPPNMFYGLAGTVAAGLAAWATTGNISRIAPALAITAGIANGSGMLVLYAESMKGGSSARTPQMLPWMLFSTFIFMGLLWFPVHGVFGPNWLPPVLLHPLPLDAIAGYGLSATPLSLALILLAAIGTGLGLARRDDGKLGAIPGFAVFLLLMAFAGMVCAFGYLQFGLGANPLILVTKAVLIFLSARSASGTAQRLQILLTALALVSIEYALTPFLAKPMIDLSGYTLLALLVLVMRTARDAPKRNAPGSP